MTPSAFLQRHPGLVVLTGAGISAASGIPTYRDHAGGWLGATPMQHGEFLASEANRKRYWARSAVGWRRITGAGPNDAHRALVRLEAAGLVSLVVTQNVDGLHRRAGQQNLVELHGNLQRVVCLECGLVGSRERLQQEFLAAYPELREVSTRPRPDGDAVLPQQLASKISSPPCPRCGGVIKPDVVFFGDAVPRQIVNRVFSALSEAPALLVVGSSLMVYSGYRFVRWMRDADKPVAAINIGATRADAILDHHWRRDAAGALLEMESRSYNCRRLGGINS